MTDNPAIEAMARAVDAEYLTLGFKLKDKYSKHVAQAALTAYHEHLAAAGFAVVPVEPTSGQRLAGLRVVHHGCPLVTYSAMIAAAKGEG